MTAGVSCPECGSVTPADRATCVHCLSSLRRATAAGRARSVATAREGIVRALARETGPLRAVRVLYGLYVALWIAITIGRFVWLTDHARPPQVLGAILLPALTLVLLVLGYRALGGGDSFACAVALAGYETTRLVLTIAGVEALGGVPLAVLLTLMLWTSAAVLAHTGRVVSELKAMRDASQALTSDLRLVAAVLVLFGGALAARLMPVGGSVEVRRSVFSGVLLVLGLVSLALLGRGSAGATLPLRTSPSDVLLALLAAAIVAALGLWLVGLVTGSWLPSLGDLSWPSPRTLLWIAVVAPIVEEWLCRGVLWEAMRRGSGVGATIVVTAVLFALLHASGRGTFLGVPWQIVGGLVFGGVRARTGSLPACVIAHGASNAVFAAVFGLEMV